MGTALGVGAATAGGVVAGWGARAVLARGRRPVHPPAALCEAAVAAVWLLLALRVATGGLPPWWLPVPAALAWLAVVLTATDLGHRRLPDALTLPAYPAAALLLAAAAVAGPGPQLAARAATGAVLLLAVHAAVHLAAPSQLGAGDVKLAGVVGAVLGAVSCSALVLGPVVAAAVTTVLALTTRGRAPAPHGPGMLAAALLVAVFPAAGAPGG